jgi:C4-type Zn-finger protein
MIVERDLQPAKQSDPRVSTVFGISIEVREVLENALDSIRCSNEPDSKVIFESDWQSEKHPAPRNTTFLGIIIDVTGEEENTHASIALSEEPD